MADLESLLDQRMSRLDMAYRELIFQIAEEDTQSGIPAFQNEENLSRKAEQDAGRIGRVEGKQVLEIGPGYGHLALLLEAKGASVSVLDLVPQYIQRLSSSISGKAYIADAQKFDLPEAFDIIVLCDVLEHVFRPADVLISCRLALKPGGTVYVRSPSHEANVYYSMGLGFPHECVHLRTYTPELLARELHATGFSGLRGPKASYSSMSIPRVWWSKTWYWNFRREDIARSNEPSHATPNGKKYKAARAADKRRYAIVTSLLSAIPNSRGIGLKKQIAALAAFFTRGWAALPPEIWVIARRVA